MIDVRDNAEVPDHGLTLALLALSLLALALVALALVALALVALSSALGTRCHVALPVGYLVIYDPMSGPVPRPGVSLSLGALLG
jgi:hypothetical protein